MSRELEHLILHTLLPVYQQYYKDRNQPVPHNHILSQLQKTHQVAKLLQPKPKNKVDR